jgi:DNA (cytosine-5)-methyltransferase 1
MRHLDLFSGIGGFALAARWMGWETVGFCEIDPFCQRVISKHWPGVEIYDDIKELRYSEPVDVITGGFPCQPFSTAAHGNNNAEDLWPEMARVVREIRPNWVIAENVPGNRNEHIYRACSDLESFGYWAEPFDVAIPMRDHIRRRVYIAAHANSDSEPRCTLDEKASAIRKAARQWRDKPEPMGVDDGVSRRMDRRKRLRALGNAIVPQVAYLIFKAIQSRCQ